MSFHFCNNTEITALAASFPFLLTGLVEVYVLIGRGLGIVDEDIPLLFRLSGIPVPTRASEEHFNSHHFKGFNEVVEKSNGVERVNEGKYSEVQQQDQGEEQPDGTKNSSSDQSSGLSSLFFWGDRE